MKKISLSTNTQTLILLYDRRPLNALRQACLAARALTLPARIPAHGLARNILVCPTFSGIRRTYPLRMKLSGTSPLAGRRLAFFAWGRHAQRGLRWVGHQHWMGLRLRSTAS